MMAMFLFPLLVPLLPEQPRVDAQVSSLTREKDFFRGGSRTRALVSVPFHEKKVVSGVGVEPAPWSQFPIMDM
jgi:hypothetical protein